MIKWPCHWNAWLCNGRVMEISLSRANFLSVSKQSLASYNFCKTHKENDLWRECIVHFICLLFVAMGKSPLIIKDVTFKIAASWTFWFFGFQILFGLEYQLQNSVTILHVSISVSRILLILSNVQFISTLFQISYAHFLCHCLEVY